MCRCLFLSRVAHSFLRFVRPMTLQSFFVLWGWTLDVMFFAAVFCNSRACPFCLTGWLFLILAIFYVARAVCYMATGRHSQKSALRYSTPQWVYTHTLTGPQAREIRSRPRPAMREEKTRRKKFGKVIVIGGSRNGHDGRRMMLTKFLRPLRANFSVRRRVCCGQKKSQRKTHDWRTTVRITPSALLFYPMGKIIFLFLRFLALVKKWF